MLTIDDVEIRFRKIFDGINISEETASALLGAVVVVIVGGFAFHYFSEAKRSEDILSQAALTVNEALLAQEQESNFSTGEPMTYIVAPGDDLSIIAQKFYGDSELWTEIVSANALASPDLLVVGQELVIPVIENDSVQVAGVEDTAEVLESSNVERFFEDRYVVQFGDSLESIALKAYGTKERWPELMQVNGLLSPDYLEVGQELVIPRSEE